MKYLFIALILTQAGMLFPQSGTPPADAILKKIDENRLADSKVIVSKMIIHGRRGERTVEAKSWQRNIDEAFTEYLAPARDRGTKMLKLGDRLWTYSPSTDRTILISGHMLRQAVMGSDLSYEDMMEDRKLSDGYTAKVSGEENVGDRRAWVMELTAKVTDIAYYRQKLWVDQERFIPLKQDLFARGGQLLKRTEMSDVRQVQGRWFPFTVLYKDMLKQGGGTEFKVTTIRFNDKIPDYIFTKAALKQ